MGYEVYGILWGIFDSSGDGHLAPLRAMTLLSAFYTFFFF